ncbi:ABC transporter ATP-binding protein [Corynebacterium sp. Q4381]|uniref:ABC transporter ATP-binding protein n=1 Tax=Corynebacterium sp. Marseille-Q4381 TaxID=3121597 RepID=UPI002FE6BB31
MASNANPGRNLLYRSLRANRGPAIAAFTAAGLSAVFQTAVPALTGRAIDIAAGNAQGSIHRIAWAMVAIALASFAVNFLRRFTSGRLASNSQHWLRVELLRTMHRLDGPGQDNIAAGQIVSRSITDLNQFHMVLASSPMLFTRALQLTTTLVVMFAMDVPLTLMALALMPLILFEANRSRRALYAATWVNQQAAADLTQHVEETVSGVRVVKAFGQEEREIDRLDQLGRELYAVKMRTAKLTARFQPVLAQLPKVALVITIVAGGLTAIRGDITVGQFVAFTGYLTAMTTQLEALTRQYVRMQMGMSSVDRLEEVLALAPTTARKAPIAPAAPTGIRFDNVSFETNGHLVLDRVTLTVAPGEQVAVVGPPGAGKSMAVQLAGGFYEPGEGSISLVDAHLNPTPYPHLTHADIRSRVTCVFDEAFLFSASVFDNIALGAQHRSGAQALDGAALDAAVREAARLARADEFIERLPNGYDTEVGERGLTLSGGQRQRIALARALMAKPAVLVLDDATSAIDAENEALILANLRSHLDGVTVIAVAHRQSTVDHADRVVVMDQGRVVADGPREEVARTEVYRGVMVEGGVGKQQPLSELWPDVPAPPPPASATPELLQRVERLPAARETPALSEAALARLREPNRDFRVRSLFKAVRWLIAATVVLLVVGVAADLAFPTLIRASIDGGIEPRDSGYLVRVGAAALVVVIVAWAADALMTVLSSRAGERLLYRLRLRSYAHLQHLGLSYFESRLSGKIITRMTTDIDTLSSFLQTGLAQAIVAVGSLAGVSAMLVATDLSLTLIALAAVPVIVAATVVFRSFSKRFYTEARRQVSAVNGQFAEQIGGIRVTQMHRGEAHAEARFAAESDHYRRLRMRTVTAMGLYFPGMQAISQIMTAVVIFIGAGRVADGTLSVGVLVAFTMYLSQLYGPIQQLGQIFDSWQQATVSFERITDLLAERTTVPDLGTAPGAAQAARGELSLVDATFSYHPDHPPVLKSLDLTFAPGETVALVGPTGAGKSTVVKLLARFYDPTTGVVTASGADIASFPLVGWRRALAQVPQESYLFEGTVADNIAYGAPGASRSEIETAVERIGALGIIAAIPGGFNARVGGRGRGLSSGQRQIIALARAEMLVPDVMLLDEATATLDPATELAVLNAADRATSGRTSVIVAHRLATAARADRVVVIDDGRIVESGTHAELVKEGGRYARMWAVHR